MSVCMLCAGEWNVHKFFLPITLTKLMCLVSLLSHIVPSSSPLSQVLVWHTRTEIPKMKQEQKLIDANAPSNPDIET